jgi:hypothetical protein
MNMASDKAVQLAQNSGENVGAIFTPYSTFKPQLIGIIKVLKRPFFRLGELVEAFNTCNKIKQDVELILETFDYWCQINEELVKAWKEDENGLGGLTWTVAELRQNETKELLETINGVVEEFSNLLLKRL